MTTKLMPLQEVAEVFNSPEAVLYARQNVARRAYATLHAWLLEQGYSEVCSVTGTGTVYRKGDHTLALNFETAPFLARLAVGA